MRIFRETDGGGNGAQPAIEEVSRVSTNLSGVGAIIAIASARGGVGKSAITVNLAATLALSGRKVGIVDADLNSPSTLLMLGMKPPRRMSAIEGIEPGSGPLGLRIAASNMLPEGEPPPVSFADFDEAAAPVVSNGASPVIELSYSETLRRLLGQTRFGSLDLLLVDLGPGLEQIYRIGQLIPRASLILVSHPSELSSKAAKTAFEFAARSSLGVIGVVENMTGFNCDGCHSVRPLMPQGGLSILAREAEVPVLGRLPFDPRFAESSDRGTLFVREYAETPLAKQIIAMAASLDRASSATRTDELGQA
jgi:ATP-binding protein involved in chromosome partitioning